MSNMNIPVGISDFRRIREENYYYIDKSGLISTLLENTPAQVTLITRPRRFGKTLGMSMQTFLIFHRTADSYLKD